MSIQGVWPGRAPREFLYTRRRVHRRILTFSACIGLITTLLTAGVYFAFASRDINLRERENQVALREIKCSNASCDVTDFQNDWQTSAPDYLIYEPTGYFLVTPETQDQDTQFTPLDFADTAFIARFSQATSYDTPDGARWRMYSRNAITKAGRRIRVLIGYEESAPWEMVAMRPQVLPQVDAELKREADLIADTYQEGNGTRNRKPSCALAATLSWIQTPKRF